MLRILTLLLSFWAASVTANDAQVEQAADAWLAIVDSGEYAVSWRKSDDFFQSQISEQDWLAAVEKARNPLGDKVVRKLVDKQTHADLPSAPSGDYLFITYRTDFETKLDTKETLILRDNAGHWGVVGYFVE
ncbi:DUF4019 domain-containing protein [Vibrio sp. LaRot3]|uniref:DUF4019 domain-containing protein n=1 Tax=Vibrio sp. LaRot3 TaxID=2998829 RepID=UPI0022CDD009|nr:DUF4019 domain-containing protein [Vibrio sp. LaRot3]MDA0150215.1 DUF4019 domain-containing protein [Vibrio sp. LaRot3]